MNESKVEVTTEIPTPPQEVEINSATPEVELPQTPPTTTTTTETTKE